MKLISPLALAGRGESRVARRGVRLRCKQSDSGAAEAAFLAGEHDPTSSTPQRERTRSRSSYFHHGLLGLAFATGCTVSPASEYDHKHLESPDLSGWEATPLRLHSDFGTVRVQSTPGESRLEVVVHERRPGDASVALQDGRLVLSTRSGEKAAIGDVTLSTHDALSDLELATGMGDVHVEAVAIRGSLRASSGMGDVIVRGLTAIERIDLASGMGAVRVSGLRCESLSLESGMGTVEVLDVHAARGKLETGMGDVIVTRSSFEALDGGTGMGKVTLEDSTRGSGSLVSGLGSVKER